MPIVVTPHIVQTASVLPATDAGWTSQASFICEMASEGIVNDVGSARILQRAGWGHLPVTSSMALQPMTATPLGSYIRVLLLDAAGPVVVGGINFTQLFQGQIVKRRTVPDLGSSNPGAVIQLDCLGIASLLDQVYIHRGYEVSFGSSTPVNPGICPAFNAKLSLLGTSDRSASTYTINGQSVYISDLSPNASSSPWTAQQLLELILAALASPNLPIAGIVGPNWTLGGTTSALGYIFDKRELHGKTVLEALNLLVNPRRGLCWQALPAASAPYNSIEIHVDSCSPVAYTAGGFTLPAAVDQNALDFRGIPFVQDFVIEEDAASCFDVIQVEGACPLVALTASIKCSSPTVISPFVSGNFSGEGLRRGWNPGNEGSWDPTIEQGPGFQNIYRRFIFGDTFNGHQWLLDATDGMRNYLATTDGGSGAGDLASFGLGGYTGDRAYLQSGSPAPAPTAGGLRLEPFVPIDGEGGFDVRSGVCPPMMFIKEGGSYEDLSSQYDITIENSPPAIVVNASPDRVAALADRLNTANVEVLFSLGVRERRPLTVSYQADSATWPRDMPRILVRRVPWAEQWVALKGTVYSVNAAGTLLNKVGSNQTMIDDLGLLKDYLAALRVWYGQPSVSVTWSVRGAIDCSRAAGYKRPGSLVTTVHRGDALVTANAVVVSRTWTLTEEGYGTTYSTRRIIPDLEAVESGMQPIRRHGGDVATGNFQLREFDPDRSISGKPLPSPIFVDIGSR